MALGSWLRSICKAFFFFFFPHLMLKLRVFRASIWKEKVNVKCGESKLDLQNVSWNFTRKDWNPCQFLLALLLVAQVFCRSHALPKIIKHTHVTQESEKLKENAEGDRRIAGSAVLTNKISQQISNNNYELPNGCCFPSSLLISQESLSLTILTGNI